MLNLLIGPIAELAGTWMSGKVEEKKAQAKTRVAKAEAEAIVMQKKATCLLYTSPSPRDGLLSRMPSSA